MGGHQEFGSVPGPSVRQRALAAFSGNLATLPHRADLRSGDEPELVCSEKPHWEPDLPGVFRTS